MIWRRAREAASRFRTVSYNQWMDAGMVWKQYVRWPLRCGIKQKAVDYCGDGVEARMKSRLQVLVSNRKQWMDVLIGISLEVGNGTDVMYQNVFWSEKSFCNAIHFGNIENVMFTVWTKRMETFPSWRPFLINSCDKRRRRTKLYCKKITRIIYTENVNTPHTIYVHVCQYITQKECMKQKPNTVGTVDNYNREENRVNTVDNRNPDVMWSHTEEAGNSTRITRVR